jgi:peptide-methionine (S)-S-oxide reductase
MTRPAQKSFRLALALGAAVLMVPLAWVVVGRANGAEVHKVPLPALDETAQTQPTEVAVLAGGCFWGVQGVFQHVKGVSSAVSGYTGGQQSTAQYETVASGTTGHAESVQITYDPRQISFGRLLNIYFSVVTDPTELDEQGPDTGPQYRSTIFPTTDQQAKIARAYIAQLNQAHVFAASVVTTVEPGRTFYAAEGYHQNFLTLNPDYPYIAINDMPKVEGLKSAFPDLYRAEPVLVATPKAAS